MAMSEEKHLDEGEAYGIAVGLLARREHSVKELAQKLSTRGAAHEVADSVIRRLIDERLQSDARYAELYLRQRMEKGYGPQRIKAELRERGVADGLIAAEFRRAFEEDGVDWYRCAAAAYRKKYGERPIEDIKERAKRQRFMQYRGFDHEQIAAALESE